MAMNVKNTANREVSKMRSRTMARMGTAVWTSALALLGLSETPCLEAVSAPILKGYEFGPPSPPDWGFYSL